MPRLLPFAAIRPPRALAALVSTRSYMTYSEEELAQKLDTNRIPFSMFSTDEVRAPPTALPLFGRATSSL